MAWPGVGAWGDLRVTVRTLGRTPAFTAAAVCTLAIGMGASTALFSVIDGVLIRPLPFEDSDRLVVVALASGNGRAGELERLSPLDLAELDSEPGLFEELAGWRGWEPTLTGSGEPRVVRAAAITEGLFTRVLRTQPALGRSFLVEEDQPGGTATALLSHTFWLEHYAGEPSALGRAVVLDGVPFTVIGVMPEGFRPPFAERAVLWTPAQLDAVGCGSGCAGVETIGRLRADVSLSVARDRMLAVSRRLAESYPETHAGVFVSVSDLRGELMGSTPESLRLLVAAVVFVLLIACVNVAGLLVVRGAEREREFAVREALGAGRRTVMGQLLTESLGLACIGGLLGVGVAAWGTDVLVELSPLGFAERDQVSLNGRVLCFTAVLSLGSGLLFGFVPAIGVTSRGLPWSAPVPSHLRRALVLGQTATATVLVVGAGLLLRSLSELGSADLGYDPEGVLAMNVALPPGGLERATDRVTFYDDLIRGLSALPGVVAVGATTSPPLDGADRDTGFRVEGRPPASSGNETAWLRRVSGGYFYTVGQRALEGRRFDERDGAFSPGVAIVNESFARRHMGYPFDNPVGAHIALEASDVPTWLTVIGVIRDTRHFEVREPEQPAIYVPFAQHPSGTMTVLLRTDGEPSALIAGAHQALADVDATLAPSRFEPLARAVSANLRGNRFVARLSGVFAFVALVLASIGLYGVVSYGVTTRIRELGIRLTLGAAAGDVRAMVVRPGVGLTLLGVALGFAGALALTGVLDALLYEVSPTDPLTYLSTAGALGIAAAIAGLLPARRVAAFDPAAALRRQR